MRKMSVQFEMHFLMKRYQLKINRGPLIFASIITCMKHDYSSPFYLQFNEKTAWKEKKATVNN